jgi:uncharacterized membrane protein (DUF2068 family)
MAEPEPREQDPPGNENENGKESEKPGGLLGFRIIGIIKLIGGVSLLAAWFGMFRFFKSDVTTELDWMARHLRLDPNNHVIHMVVSELSGLDRKKLHAIEAGTFLYALLHLLEGTGLVLERTWAGYLTVIATSWLVPFEIYEVIHRFNALKIFVLIVNLGFVAYVAVKLRQERRAHAERLRAQRV